MHNDTHSLHVHAVIGAINLETGKKMHGNWHEYRERLVKITDKVVKSHGLAVTVPQKRPEKRSMAEIKMKARGQMTWKDQIRNAIDTTMSDAHISDFKTFKDKLMEKAINVYERGKELTYELTGTKYKARGSKLGDDYKKETIKMSWTDDTNDNTEQEENLIALGLMDVENELKKNNKLVLDLKREQRESNTRLRTTNCKRE